MSFVVAPSGFDANVNLSPARRLGASRVMPVSRTHAVVSTGDAWYDNRFHLPANHSVRQPKTRRA